MLTSLAAGHVELGSRELGAAVRAHVQHSMTRPCSGKIKRARDGATSDPLGQVAAELLAASAESDAETRMDVDGEAGGGGAAGELRPRLLAELGAILAPAGPARGGARPGPAPDPVLTAAALDAAGALGATRGGAELLLADEPLAGALAALALQGTGADLLGVRCSIRSCSPP